MSFREAPGSVILNTFLGALGIGVSVTPSISSIPTPQDADSSSVVQSAASDDSVVVVVVVVVVRGKEEREEECGNKERFAKMHDLVFSSILSHTSRTELIGMTGSPELGESLHVGGTAMRRVREELRASPSVFLIIFLTIDVLNVTVGLSLT